VITGYLILGRKTAVFKLSPKLGEWNEIETSVGELQSSYRLEQQQLPKSDALINFRMKSIEGQQVDFSFRSRQRLGEMGVEKVAIEVDGEFSGLTNRC
jgi:hypothetical protein